ncbi:MAG: Sec-independent protein translocase protein TatB [Brevundimonas sp.]
MGGLGPGIGGTELLVIGLVALLVVGPKDLPVLMRKLGKLMARARGMANEFRASFDEMARQSELDELRKEVEALRTNQGIHALGTDAGAAFRDIGRDLDSGLAPAPPVLPAPDEWPDAGPAMTPLDPGTVPPAPVKAAAKARVARSTGAKATPAKATAKLATKPTARTDPKRAPAAKPAAGPRTRRTRKVDL